MVKRCMAIAAGMLAASSVPALAVTPIVYAFTGFIEYGSAPGTVPVGLPTGSLVIITIIVDASVPGTVNGNTASYTGGICNYPVSSPILWVKISKGSTFNFGNGSCNNITITKNAGGTSSITMSSGSSQIGPTFVASFTTVVPGEISSLAIPKTIVTTAFERSAFSLRDPVFAVSGDMTKR